MDPTLTIILAVPWLLVFLHLMLKRDFEVMLGWIFLAPIATYLIQMTPRIDLYRGAGGSLRNYDSEFYYKQATSITLQELIDPTRLLVILLFIILVLNILLKKVRPIPIDRTEWWMSLFSLILLTNVLLWSERRAFGLRVAIDAFIVPFLAYYLARRLVSSEERFKKLMRALAYMGVYVIGFCLIERVTTPGLFYRLGGPFYSRDVLHVVMAVAFFTAVLDSMCNLSSSNKKYALSPSIRRLIIIVAPIIVALTVTRGNWVGLLAGIFIFLLLGRRFFSMPGTLRLFGSLLIALPLMFIILQFAVPEDFVEGRVAKADNVLGRFATWNATVQLTLEAPFAGVGLNNLNGLLARMSTKFDGFGNYSTPHNSYLSIVAELGAIGLFAYIGIVISIIQRGLNLYRKRHSSHDLWRGITLLALMAAYQVPSLFANTFYISGLIHVYMYTFVGGIAGLCTLRHSASYVHSSATVAQKPLRPPLLQPGSLRFDSRVGKLK
jgi:O-antigen ligase